VGGRRKLWLASVAAATRAILACLWVGTGCAPPPSDADAHYQRGAALQAEGHSEEAIAEYRTAISLKHDHAKAHYSLGNALSDLGRFDEAKAEWRAAIRFKPD
jgi:tetratricopeptide (TPR) repeat protein